MVDQLNKLMTNMKKMNNSLSSKPVAESTPTEGESQNHHYEDKEESSVEEKSELVKKQTIKKKKKASKEPTATPSKKSKIGII